MSHLALFPQDAWFEILTFLPTENTLPFFKNISSLSWEMYEIMKRVPARVHEVYKVPQVKFCCARLCVREAFVNRENILDALVAGATDTLQKLHIDVPFFNNQDGSVDPHKLFRKVNQFQYLKELSFTFYSSGAFPKQLNGDYETREKRDALSEKIHLPHLESLSVNGISHTVHERRISPALAYLEQLMMATPKERGGESALKHLSLAGISTFPTFLRISPHIERMDIHLEERLQEMVNDSSDYSSMKSLHALVAQCSSCLTKLNVVCSEYSHQQLEVNLNPLLRFKDVNSMRNLKSLRITVIRGPMSSGVLLGSETALAELPSLRNLTLEGCLLPYSDSVTHLHIGRISTPRTVRDMFPLHHAVRHVSLSLDAYNLHFPELFFETLAKETAVRILDFPQQDNLWSKMGCCLHWNTKHIMPQLKYMGSTYRDEMDVLHMLFVAPNARLVIVLNDLPRFQPSDLQQDSWTSPKKEITSSAFQEFIVAMRDEYFSIMEKVHTALKGRDNRDEHHGRAVLSQFYDTIRSHNPSRSDNIVPMRSLCQFVEFCILAEYQMKNESTLEYMKSVNVLAQMSEEWL